MRLTGSSIGLRATATLTALTTLYGMTAAAAAPRQSDFFVDGKKLPGISSVIGDVGDSYAGLLPITNKVNETDEMFFWLWPPAKGAPSDSLTIWFGGGPGCSGLTGMMQQNGPFILPDNQQNKAIVKKNPNSWTNSGWIMYIDQPSTTGFSQVAPRDDLNQLIIAQQIRGFLDNLYKVFPDLRKKDLYLSGESYAGQYIPHFADYLYNQTGNDKLPLKGVGIQSGLLLDDTWQNDIPYYEYLVERQADLQLNASVMQDVKKHAQELGLVNYYNTTLQYPPRKGPILPPKQYTSDPSKQLEDLVVPHYFDENSCFNYYDIRERCPTPYNPLSQRADFFSNTKGFKKAIHVSEDDNWAACKKPSYIFTKPDPTPKSMTDGSLARVIDKSQRSVLWGGEDDIKVLALGTQLGLQNITWGGVQGFQKKPTDGLIAAGKHVGTYHTERKLTWALLQRAGHFAGMFQPEATLKMHKYLLGQIQEADLGK